MLLSFGIISKWSGFFSFVLVEEFITLQKDRTMVDNVEILE